MEPENVFADKVRISRPKLFEPVHVAQKPGAGQVIRQGVEPDIDHMVGVAGNGDAPVEGGSAYRQVVQPAFHEACHFVMAHLGHDESLVLFQVAEQGLAVSSTS